MLLSLGALPLFLDCIFLWFDAFMRNSYPVLYRGFLGSASQALWVTCPKMKCLTSDALQPFISSVSVWSDFWVTELALSVPEEAYANICLLFLPFSSILDTAKWKHACMYNSLFFKYILDADLTISCVYMYMCIAGDIYLCLCVYLYTHSVLRDKCPQLFRKHWKKKKWLKCYAADKKFTELKSVCVK